MKLMTGRQMEANRLIGIQTYIDIQEEDRNRGVGRSQIKICRKKADRQETDGGTRQTVVIS